jgi:hypothetical protein
MTCFMSLKINRCYINYYFTSKNREMMENKVWLEKSVLRELR